VGMTVGALAAFWADAAAEAAAGAGCGSAMVTLGIRHPAKVERLSLV